MPRTLMRISLAEKAGRSFIRTITTVPPEITPSVGENSSTEGLGTDSKSRQYSTPHSTAGLSISTLKFAISLLSWQKRSRLQGGTNSMSTSNSVSPDEDKGTLSDLRMPSCSGPGDSTPGVRITKSVRLQSGGVAEQVAR